MNETRQLLSHLWNHGPLSRWELHERTGWTPNAVGAASGRLIEEGILRECPSRVSGRGRPRIPLEIDPEMRHVIGLSIAVDQIRACRFNLRGRLLGEVSAKPVRNAEEIPAAADEMVAGLLNEQTLAVGVSASCFVEPDSKRLLLNSVAAKSRKISLQRLYARAGGVPVVLENDMHALAARWSLARRAPSAEDVLLVYFRDGSLGAAMLIDGKPNRGCAISANELGHMRLAVETDRCFCGQTGCLERVVSSDFLRRAGAPTNAVLREEVERFDGSSKAMNALISYLAMGLANAVNFMRPHRLLLVSEAMRCGKFAQTLRRRTRDMMLPELRGLVRLDAWDQPATELAETAGYLALAKFYSEGWSQEQARFAPRGRRARRGCHEKR
jgi:predicted NBD/HSP70 family sugar kinase